MTTSNNMKLNKIKPIFSNSKKQNDTAIEDSFSDSSDNDFIQIVKKLYANQGISEFSDNEISKWLIASDLDVKKAIESINETLSWRKTIQIQSIIHHDYSDMSELGKIVLKGKSLDGSLLLWWIGNKNQWSNSKDREIKYFIHLIEKSRKEDSSLSKLTLVYDLNGTKSEKSDINLIFSILEILGKHFPESLNRIFIFPKSSFTSMFMKMSPVNLKPEILSRITISSGPETLFACISTDNILTKYGGNLSLPALTETTPALPIKPIIEQIWVAPDDLLMENYKFKSLESQLSTDFKVPKRLNSRPNFNNLDLYTNFIRDYDIPELQVENEFKIDYLELRNIQNRDWAIYLVSQGVDFANSNDYEKAFIKYKTALDLDNECVSAWIAQGIAYANNRQYTDAIKNFKKALEINPNHSKALEFLKSTKSFYNNLELERESAYSGEFLLSSDYDSKSQTEKEFKLTSNLFL